MKKNEASKHHFKIARLAVAWRRSAIGDKPHNLTDHVSRDTEEERLMLVNSIDRYMEYLETRRTVNGS
jgi:hypothetical protein